MIAVLCRRLSANFAFGRDKDKARRCLLPEVGGERRLTTVEESDKGPNRSKVVRKYKQPRKVIQVPGNSK